MYAFLQFPENKPSTVVQKLIGHKYTIFHSLQCHFARFLVESWKKYFHYALVDFLAVHELKSSGGKAELVACSFLAVELKLPIIESSEEQQKDYDAGQRGF